MPQAILLQDIDTLGAKGEVVEVSNGYFRNYLLPHKLAEGATQAAIAQAALRREAAERAAREAIQKARDIAETLSRTVLTIPQQAGDDGRLFGSVTTQDIADAIREARGLRVDRRRVHLSDPIKSVGTFQVTVEVAENVQASVKTIVVAS